MGVLASRKLGSAALRLALPSVALLLAAGRPAWSRGMAVLAAAVSMADVTVAARPVNPLAPLELVTHRPPFVEQIAPADARLLSVGDSLETLNRSLVRGPAGWEPEWRMALGTAEMIGAPQGVRWGFRGSYDPDFTGLAPPALPFMSALVRQVEATPLGVRLLEMGGVGWVIDPRPSGFPLLPERVRAQSVFAEPLHLLRVPDPLPACFVVDGVSRASTDEAAVARIAASDFDPRREAVLAGSGDTRRPGDGWSARARLVLRRANRLQVETETSGPGMLIVLEAFDPDWRATVDGAEVAVERANVLFRGVAVPAGRHLVELRYFPPSVAWGLGLGAAGIVLLLAMLTGARGPHAPRPGTL
jgi:hypothetical protein